MKVSELKAMVDSGIVVPIIFNQRIEDNEYRYEEGMKAYIVGTFTDDVCICFKTEERDFAEYNKSLEKPIWGASGVYDSKYSDGDFSNPSDKNIWEGGEGVDDEIINFTVISVDSQKLFKEYLDSESECSYVLWLENKLLEARKDD